MLPGSGKHTLAIESHFLATMNAVWLLRAVNFRYLAVNNNLFFLKSPSCYEELLDAQRYLAIESYLIAVKITISATKLDG